MLYRNSEAVRLEGDIMNFKEVPMGFSMALAQNEKALNVYAGMRDEQKEEVIDKARNVKSKQEMQSLVNELVINS